MGEEKVTVELTESDIYMVKTLAVMAHALCEIQNGPRSWNSLHKNLELKMLKAFDAVKAKKMLKALDAAKAKKKKKKTGKATCSRC